LSRRSVGNEAERRAAQHLQTLGYRVVCRNYTCRMGELDLVCEERGVLCFVEVRMRSSARHGLALETISREKRRRIILAAEHYLATSGGEERACRFDVVTIDGDGAPALLRDAFGAAG
jgi:putative endonuclease